MDRQGHSPLTLFYAYTDQDENLCEELEKHLSILQRQEMIAGWHHHKMLPGSDKDQINDEQFSSAQIIVLLISPDFLASDASHAEMERALQRHEAGLAVVIPLLLRPVDWQSASFAHLPVLPRNGLAVTMWENRDEAFADIAKDIRLTSEQWNRSSFKALVPMLPAPFLCSARKDLPLLKRLKEDLTNSNMIKEKDQLALQPESSDSDKKEDLREAISLASAVILVATPYTRRSRSIKQALHIAEMYQHTLYLFWMQGNHLREVIPTGYEHLPVIDARGARYPQALQELIQAIGRLATSSSAPDASSEPRPLLAEPRNPYKGLQAFRTEDVQDFFGRTRLIEELLEKAQQLLIMNQQEQSAARLLTILGPSGSGKSSLAMAGLLPRLQQGGLAGSEKWSYLTTMVPGKHPLEALALTLAPLFPQRSPVKIMHDDLEDDSARGLHLLLTMYAKSSGGRVLLIIDQFEELFTQTATEDERRHFLELLLTAITEPDGPLLAVITLRADFYDRPLLYPELGHIIEKHHVTCYPLETRDLRAVIERPAQLPDVQLTFEDGLVGDLLFDVQGQVGALPLLQFTLDRLFQHRQERILSQHAYHQIGGVKGALAQHAEASYQALSTENLQRLARALFLRLINPGTVEEDATRRRIPLSELIVIDQEKTARLAEVAAAFTKARLLTANTVGGISTIEVSHEALIQAWMRLRNWLHESRDAIHLQQSISEDTAKWNQHGQPTERLYRASQLNEALRWREDNLPSLDEDRFLQASSTERLRIRRRTFLIGLVGVTSVTGSGFLVTALLRSQVKTPPAPPPPTFTYTGQTGIVYSVAWSPDGKRIASASSDNTVQVWNANSGRLLLTYSSHTKAVYTVAWSPDGKRIASSSDDTTVRVWDASNGHSLLTYQGHVKAVYSAAWSPDGKRIASSSDDTTVQVWDANSGLSLLTYRGHTKAVGDAAWSPDSQRIASSSDDTTVRVWDASNGHLLLTYQGHPKVVDSVAWSPDGKRIASASEDMTVQVWDTSNGNHLFTRSSHTNIVSCVAWSPDGKQIASSSLDETVQVWDANSSIRQLTYTGHIIAVYCVAWSPDGKRIVSADNDAIVRVWNARNGSGYGSQQFITYTGNSSLVFSAAWSPDGKRIVSASFNKIVQVWDVNSGTNQLTYTGHTNAVNSVAWSPAGDRIASASDDKTIQVWDASGGHHLFTLGGHTNIVSCVAWSPDNKRIASASWDMTVRVWDARSGRHLFTSTNHKNRVNSVAWSPNSQLIASASDDKTVQIWDASSGKILLTYTGHFGQVNSVAWSPDGKRIASASADNTVQVWNTSNGSRQFAYPGHTEGDVSCVAWSPNGKRLAFGSRALLMNNNTIQVRDANNDGILQLTYIGHTRTICSVAWSPDSQLIASASEDDSVQVWNPDDQEL